MTVSKVSSIYQNPNYFSGTGAQSLTLTTTGTLSAASLFDEKYLNRRYEYNQTRESYEIASSGRDAVISNKINNIVSHIENGNEAKAMKAYNSLLNEMMQQSRYSRLVNGDDDCELRAVARKFIESQSGEDLEDLIRENMDTAFEKGFKVDFSRSSYSQEDMLREMCDLDESDVITTPARILGNLSRIVACTAAGAGIGSVVPVIGPPVGAAVGAAVGILGCLF